ncbi:MAG TPA: carboxypeptidase-like regulatory domain-containing protein [Acidobacteriaceae bacterium]|nr:carboxypeptidase-like regulatory domain-containing protein [Acidobacteriaceae bacterium]
MCLLLLSPGSRGQSAAPPPQAAPAGPANASAQVSTGGTKVHGTITDPDGELIPGATVTFTPAKGPGRTVKSGSDGTYNITITPGSYTMLVSMPGFASYLMTNLRVPAVASTTLDAKLKIGQENTVINVEASAVQLSVDPDSNASSTILQGKDLEALSDDPDELQSELTALAGPSAGPNGGQIYVDGFTGGQLPPKSSIREIRINQNPFSAEYDKLGYGRVEVFTKPGTDKLHGNFQINGNPSQFNSGTPPSFSSTPIIQPPYHTMFMFGNLTGPLTKTASYNLGGTFRQIQDDEYTTAQILATSPGSQALCNPGATGCSLSTFQQETYYPQLRVDVNPRLDLALGEKNVMTMRYQFVRNTSTNGGISNRTIPTAGFNSSSMSNILQLSDTETFSSKLVNETRFEYEREHVATNALNNLPTVTVSGDFTAGGYSGQNLSDHQDHYEFQNYTSLQLKKNFIRMGARLRATREAENTEGNTNGEFVYSTLTTCVPSSTTTCPTIDNSYQTGSPREFTYTQVNNHTIDDTYTDLGLYAETDWKPRQNMTVSYGARYETQNHLRDHHDFAPRVAINYGLFTGHGAPKTVLRGGFGIFYDRFAQGSILTLQQENGTNETVYTVENPGGTCTPNLNQPITQALISACIGNASASTQTTYSAASNLRTPYTMESAVGADQQVGRFGTLSINYVHSQGVHEFATQNINYDPTKPGPLSASTGPQYQFFSGGIFNQNQLILNGRAQTTKWLSIFGYYSLNSAHGDTSGGFVTTPFNIKADYGRTTFDVRNRFFVAGSITLPHYIQFSPFMIGQSGTPFNITTGTDNNNDSILNDRPYLANGATPNGRTIESIPGCGTFAQPGTPGLPANSSIVPINYCTGPSLFTLNFRLTKTWGFGGLRNAQAASAGGQGGGPGGSGGGGHHGGGGGGGGRGGPGGGPGFFGGGGSSTGKRYNVALGMQVQNLFGNNDLSTPNGVLTSPQFGQSTALQGGPYTTQSAIRRILLQASFNF